MVMWSGVSEEGRDAAALIFPRPDFPPARPLTSTWITWETARADLSAPLAVIASLSGSRVTTALKLPLVPRAHPREWKSRPMRANWKAAVANRGSLSGSVMTHLVFVIEGYSRRLG